MAELPWGRLGLTICYDVRFPELFLALRRAGAEVIFLPSAFTLQTGKDHWEVLARARAIHSLCAVFGETYPDPVRVISIGVPVSNLVEDPESAEWSGFSVELCGGTHVAHSSQIGALTMTGESSVGSGVRRVEEIGRASCRERG